MNEEVLTNIGEQVLGWLRASEELVVTQAPLLVEEIIIFGRAAETAYVILFVILLGLTPLLLQRCRKLLDGGIDDEPAAFATGLGAVVALVMGGAGVLVHLEPLVMVWFAPKLYVMKVIGSFL